MFLRIARSLFRQLIFIRTSQHKYEKKLEEGEEKIFQEFLGRIDNIRSVDEKILKEQLVSRVRAAGYCLEDWQCNYSVEAIFDHIQQKIAYGDLTEEQIEYISSWSWTAFFGSFIFTLGSKLYLWTLGYFVPLYNVYLIFYLASNGRRLSYLKGWKNFDEFKKHKLRWVGQLEY